MHKFSHIFFFCILKHNLLDEAQSFTICPSFCINSTLSTVFVPIFAFINDKKASNIDLAGNIWFGQDANISSKNTQSTCTMKINSYSAS